MSPAGLDERELIVVEPQRETYLPLCLLVQTGELRPIKIILLAGPFVREKEVDVCGAEIAQFVGNRSKRNIPQRQSRAPAVSSSGKART
jgi:hypothetical protein